MSLPLNKVSTLLSSDFPIYPLLSSMPDSGVWSVTFQLFLLLAGALFFGMLFERMRQSAILGYLLAGTILGPGVLDFVQAGSGVPVIAELGVSLLLFAIGLEFSAKRLLKLGSIAVGGGSIQVIATLGLTSLVAMATGYNLQTSLAVGAMVALSSTACVLRVLTDRTELDSLHGRSALGILLLQDVAVVPLVLLVTMLGGAGSAGEMAFGFAKAIGLILLLVVVFFILSHQILPRVLHSLSMSRDRELLILLAAVLAIGSAFAAHALELSPALGAFVAGVMLAESPFATQIRSDISALRTLFITLFFASVGMLGNPVWIFQNFWLVGLTALSIMLGKAIIVALIAKQFRLPTRYALAAGVSLSQVGEFSIVIAGIALQNGLFDQALFGNLVSATLIALFLTPLLVRKALPIGSAIEKYLPKSWCKPSERDIIADSDQGLSGHIILVGFGPSGQQVGKALLGTETEALVIDLRKPNIDLARSMGLKAEFGDATHLDVLIHHGVSRAKAIVITVPDHRTSVKIVESVSTLAPNIRIIVRARYHQFVSELEQAGATVVVNEERHTGRRIVAALRATL